jgi:hypothetical protein
MRFTAKSVLLEGKAGCQKAPNRCFVSILWAHIHLYDHKVYEKIYREKMAVHWDKKDRMGDDRSMGVNWEACEAAMQQLKISRGHWIAKHTEGMCGVGKWLVTWNERKNADCPRCSAPKDARHVWLWCPAAEAKLICNEGISGIAQWMEEVQTDPEIRTALGTRLAQWADNSHSNRLDGFAGRHPTPRQHWLG